MSVNYIYIKRETSMNSSNSNNKISNASDIIICKTEGNKRYDPHVTSSSRFLASNKSSTMSPIAPWSPIVRIITTGIEFTNAVTREQTSTAIDEKRIAVGTSLPNRHRRSATEPKMARNVTSTEYMKENLLRT